MPAWNETHYTRAQEFISLLSDTLAPAAEASDLTVAPFAPPIPAPTPGPARTSPAPQPVSPPAPAPAAAPASATSTVPPPTPTGPTAAPATAAGLFKKMPWKK